MAERKLLREFYGVSIDPKILKEDRDRNGGRLLVKGVIQRAEAKNQNGRVYPRHILEREVENYQKVVRENRALGECDHPDTSVVSLYKSSHVIREMHWEGNDLMGTIEILPKLPCGKILEGLIESGITLGISSRGLGSTTQNETGADVVQDDFQLCAFDMVSEPSTHVAFMQLSEGRDFKGIPLERPDRVFRSINSFLLRKGLL
jgi:hypothetical protein